MTFSLRTNQTSQTGKTGQTHQVTALTERGQWNEMREQGIPTQTIDSVLFNLFLSSSTLLRIPFFVRKISDGWLVECWVLPRCPGFWYGTYSVPHIANMCWARLPLHSCFVVLTLYRVYRVYWRLAGPQGTFRHGCLNSITSSLAANWPALCYQWFSYDSSSSIPAQYE